MIKSFFAFLILFLISYYLIKAVVRLFKLFTANKAEGNKSTSTFFSKKGNVTFQNTEPRKKHFDKDTGDYVDYEEVK